MPESVMITGRKAYEDMDSLPKLDTSTEPWRSTSRASYASTTDSYPPSARSSITSISDRDSSYCRSSYSSTSASLNRASSFSRSACEFLPESVENTPINVENFAPETGSQCQIHDEMNRFVVFYEHAMAISDSMFNLGQIEPHKLP